MIRQNYQGLRDDGDANWDDVGVLLNRIDFLERFVSDFREGRLEDSPSNHFTSLYDQETGQKVDVPVLGGEWHADILYRLLPLS